MCVCTCVSYSTWTTWVLNMLCYVIWIAFVLMCVYTIHCCISLALWKDGRCRHMDKRRDSRERRGRGRGRGREKGEGRGKGEGRKKKGEMCARG